MDKRKYPRIKTRMLAAVNSKQGLLENVSREGVKLKLMADAVPQSQEVDVEFEIGEKVFKLRGIVRWCRRDKFSFQNLREVGLSLVEPPPEFYDFVDTLAPNHRAERN